MFEKATALVTAYNAMIMVAIACVGIATATVWTLVNKQRVEKSKAE